MPFGHEIDDWAHSTALAACAKQQQQQQ